MARCCLTLQSISEFYAVVTRKGKMPPAEGVRIAEWMISLFQTVTASADAVRAALRLAASGQASYWDALLLHTAAEAGCAAILTEDLGDQTVVAGLRIINPFADGALAPAADALLSAE
jgi:predicted nucleic acid-binding protein